MEFLNLDATFGKKKVTYDDADFNSVDFSKEFGLKQIDAESLAKFYDILAS